MELQALRRNANQKSILSSHELSSSDLQSKSSKRVECRSPQRASVLPLLNPHWQLESETSHPEYKIHVTKEDSKHDVSHHRTPLTKESRKCHKFFREIDVSNLESTCGSDTEHPIFPSYQRTNKNVLSPIPLIHPSDFSSVLESMKMQRKFLHGSFIVNDKNEQDQDKIIQTFEFGFLRQKKRYAINMKLNQLKKSTQRSEAIKSVLEYTKTACRDQIADDLKQLEKEIKLNNLEKSLLSEQTEGFEHQIEPKSSKEIKSHHLHHVVNQKRRRSSHIDKIQVMHHNMV